MAVNKGLKTILESSPNFSNQALENAINDIKAVDQDDGHQFILSQFLVDEAIRDNTVLTTSQKNDALEAIIAAQPHLQIGRILSDLVRHTASQIDGSMMTATDDVSNPVSGTFLEMLQLCISLQTTIPNSFGVTPAEKSRSVQDHFGILDNMFTRTEDSSEPVFTRLKRIMQKIDTTSRANTVTGLNGAISNAAVANLNLRTFLDTITDDSTDFQTTLDNRVNSIVSMFSTLNTKISEIPGGLTAELVEIREAINVQVSLEETNVKNLRTFTSSLSDNSAFAALADNDDIRKLLAKAAQNVDWQNYYNTYEAELANINPIFASDSIDSILASRGLPDVVDSTDIDSVANKAKQDDRIDTAGFDKLTVEQVIARSCTQLKISDRGTVFDQSRRLLNNLNANDRDLVVAELKAHNDADTLS